MVDPKQDAALPGSRGATVEVSRRSIDSRAFGAQSLVEAFLPRSNSLGLMRLVLAGLVAVAHAFAVGFGHQPVLGRTFLADFAVDGFFVLSGFLVTRSFVRAPSVGRYAWHRFLRLMPGFWVCLLVTALVLAPLAAVLVGRSAGSVFTASDEPAWAYPLVNAALPIVQFGIAGISSASGQDAFDGALWTLQYEAFCYAVVALLGVTAVFRSRRWVVLVLCLAVWLGALADSADLFPADVPVFDNHSTLRFLLVFLLGAAGFLFAERVPVHAAGAVFSGVVVVAAAFLPDYRLVAAVPFAYLCLYGMVRLPAWHPKWDLSYGLYVYHWPIQFLLLLAGVDAIGEWPFMALSVVLALGAAAASWLLVEGPALRRKDLWWRQSTTIAPTSSH